MAQVAKVAPDRFTMFVMPEFVTPDRYIYGVDNEYNGVVIRGECYDRQFMFGKGAGGSPTASSILSDVMARCHDYRYEYKKMGFANRPTFTDDVVLHVYARYNATDVVALLPWRHIDESYRSAEYKYVIGDVALSDLYARRIRTWRKPPMSFCAISTDSLSIATIERVATNLVCVSVLGGDGNGEYQSRGTIVRHGDGATMP